MNKTNVRVYGKCPAVVVQADDEGAVVRELDDSSETWFSWDDLTEEPIGRHATPSPYPATDNLVALYRVWALIGADCYPNEGKHARIAGDR